MLYYDLLGILNMLSSAVNDIFVFTQTIILLWVMTSLPRHVLDPLKADVTKALWTLGLCIHWCDSLT